MAGDAGLRRSLEPSNAPSDDAPGPAQKRRRLQGADSSSLATTTGANNAKPGPSGEAVLLRPRKLQINPAGYGMRLPYLTKLHQFMTILNDGAKKSRNPDLNSRALSPEELIVMAVDEEARIATESQPMYPGVIKQRMMHYKKMTVDEWIKSLEAQTTAPKKDELDHGHLINLLRKMVTPQDNLEEHGYVIRAPSEAQIAGARKNIEANGGHEECARCQSRFLVLSERREDGALTNGGSCRYHWGRIAQLKNGDKRFRCCNGHVGLSPGCETAPTHVFQVKDVARQALILQFEETPEATDAHTYDALAIDCEMAYTTLGNEMMRVTALAWPGNKKLLDVLVRPLGAVLDLNTRFSGLTAAMLANAKPYAPSEGPDADGLQLAASPAAARSLVHKLMGPNTVLIGHAIENDLRTLRMLHPNIVDTVLLCPHSRGLPYRRALRDLTIEHLGRYVQVAGAVGHDSLEDAVATGDVVERLARKRWEAMKLKGWKAVEGGEFVQEAGGKSAG